MVAVRASEIGNLPKNDVWAFEAIKELFVREKGFDLEAYKERCILRRVYLKVRSRGHKDLGSYYRVLRRDPEELEHLFQYLTINVTEFFRNPAAFQYLERMILPRVMQEHSHFGTFEIWSAGCSSGEEPYSLAMSVLRARKLHGIKTAFHILATDVDKTILKRAKEGIYTSESLKNINVEERSQFFRKEGNAYRVCSELRDRVTFRNSDLLRENPERMHSIIVCRNLLIYFSRENQERIITGFARNIREGGYLMLGKAETLIGRNRFFFQSISPAERVYKLREAPLADLLTESF